MYFDKTGVTFYSRLICSSRETPRFDRPQNSILTMYLYRDSLIGCCSGLSFRQRREPIRGPAVASRHWYKMFGLNFASHGVEGQESTAYDLSVWSVKILLHTPSILCWFRSDRKQTIDRGGISEGAKTKGIGASQRQKKFFRLLRSQEVREK